MKIEAYLREGCYRAIRWYMVKGLKTYFNNIEFEGREKIPKDKPFILVVNHQNAFLDPIIAALLIPWLHCHFLTRSDVFNKWTSYFLETIKMHPIYRIRDGIDQLGKNQEVFDNCTKLFENNSPVLVFPEGNHGENHYLRPLKKGAARIAFHAQQKMEKELMIVPCGLNYFAHRTPRTKLISVYGDPISVKKYLKGYQEDKQKGLKNLTNNMAIEMKKCLIIPDKTNDYEIKVKKVFNPENEVLSFKKLRELASRDYTNDPTQFVSVPKTSFQRSMIWLAGIPNFGPLYLLKRILAGTKDKVFYGTMKFIVMLFSMPIWWLLGFLLGYFLFGIAEGFVMVGLSLIGLFVGAELKK
ncbi:MAG: hypothetical protein GY816_13335 [Cytophagales bacterium]|nr:hypothetical protein [Cytophagales bacterium]